MRSARPTARTPLRRASRSTCRPWRVCSWSASCEILGRLLRDPAKPFVVVLGGLKVSDKIGVIEKMLGMADAILVGGAMANAFLAAKGCGIGQSKGGDGDQVAVAAKALAAAGETRCALVLPRDLVVAREAVAGAALRVVAADGVAPDEMALDIGPQTAVEFVRHIRGAGTIYWNGPMGLFELDDFSAGTKAVGEAIAASASVTVAGGGDTVAAVRRYGLEAHLTHVSTGGGASMEFLEGRALPGVEALMDRGTTAAAGRRPLMAGNWKMYKTPAQTKEFFNAFRPLVAGVADRDVLICPPSVCIHAALSCVVDTGIEVGAQTMHYAAEGAFTGEIAPQMLRELAVPYVILGHSERRQYYAENDVDLARKVRAALDAGLRPVLCCGETLEEREAGRTEDKVGGQLDADLAEVGVAELALVAIAYEPIWAIGTGVTATSEQAQETVAFCRRRVRERFGDAADGVRILYGGSVKPGNIDELMAQPDIDGVLVGGASLDPADFARIVHFVEPPA